MADIYMHSRLTEDVIPKISNKIDTNIAFLGAHGPDPMYYNTFDKDHKRQRKIADNMHRYDTRDLLIGMTNYVKQNYNLNTYSFLVGFICHYSLDVHIHPYVYNKVGIYDIEDPNTHKLRGLHLKFERSIDCLLIKKEQKTSPRKVNLTKKYFPLKQANEDVLKLMGNTIKTMYDIDDGKEIFQKSVKAMYNMTKYINADRFGIKKQIYKIIDLFYKGKDMMYKDLSFFNHLENYDFHNDAKKEWNHPLTGEVYNYSVIELYDQALQFAVELIVQVDDYLANNNDIDLTTVFTNLSFNSGVNCDQGLAFKYFDIYRK